MLVHQSQAGCIIGKAGSKIKELREVSTAAFVCLQFITPVLPEIQVRLVRYTGI